MSYCVPDSFLWGSIPHLVDLDRSKEYVVFDLDDTLVTGMAPSIVPRPGVMGLLTNLKSLEVGLILWSAGNFRHVYDCLSFLGVIDLFDAVICRGDDFPSWMENGVVEKDIRVLGVECVIIDDNFQVACRCPESAIILPQFNGDPKDKVATNLNLLLTDMINAYREKLVDSFADFLGMLSYNSGEDENGKCLEIRQVVTHEVYFLKKMFCDPFSADGDNDDDDDANDDKNETVIVVTVEELEKILVKNDSVNENSEYVHVADIEEQLLNNPETLVESNEFCKRDTESCICVANVESLLLDEPVTLPETCDSVSDSIKFDDVKFVTEDTESNGQTDSDSESESNTNEFFFFRPTSSP